MGARALGGIPTAKPDPINAGKTLKEMIKQEIKDVENAITMYKHITEMAEKEGDVTTAFMFREILEQEEGHHDTFTTLYEEV